MQAAHLFVGVYHDETKASKAVEELLDVHVPLDDIHVTVRDEDGAHEVSVEHRTGMTLGGLVGGALGAMAGGVAGTLLSTGVLAHADVPLAAPAPVIAALQGIAVGAMGGAVLGVLGGMGHWEEKPNFKYEDLETGEALIYVSNQGLQDAARRVFERTHADRIDDESGGWTPGKAG